MWLEVLFVRGSNELRPKLLITKLCFIWQGKKDVRKQKGKWDVPSNKEMWGEENRSVLSCLLTTCPTLPICYTLTDRQARGVLEGLEGKESVEWNRR